MLLPSFFCGSWSYQHQVSFTYRTKDAFAQRLGACGLMFSVRGGPTAGQVHGQGKGTLPPERKAAENSTQRGVGGWVPPGQRLSEQMAPVAEVLPSLPSGRAPGLPRHRLVECMTGTLKHRLARRRNGCAALNGARRMRSSHGQSKRMTIRPLADEGRKEKPLIWHRRVRTPWRTTDCAGA